MLKRLSIYETYFEKSSSSKKFSDEKTFFVIKGQILLFFNLKPAPLRGIMSMGMLLAGDGEEGKAVLVAPPANTKIGAGSILQIFVEVNSVVEILNLLYQIGREFIAETGLVSCAVQRHAWSPLREV